jgi:hypothetical protein
MQAPNGIVTHAGRSTTKKYKSVNGSGSFHCKLYRTLRRRSGIVDIRSHQHLMASFLTTIHLDSSRLVCKLLEDGGQPVRGDCAPTHLRHLSAALVWAAVPVIDFMEDTKHVSWMCRA